MRRLARWLLTAVLAFHLGSAAAQTTDHVGVPYQDASGGSHSLDTQTNNNKMTTYSQPAVNGTPVTPSAPLPVIAEPGSKSSIDQTTPGTTNNVTLSDAAGHAVAANLNGFLRTVTPGTSLFYEDWSSGAINASKETAANAGGGVAASFSVGTATIATGTTANGYSYIQSIPTFQPVAPAFLNIEHAIQLPAVEPANTCALWGEFTLPASPTCAAPATDGFGFMVTTAGILEAVTYAGGTLNVIATLTRPSDGAVHVYFMFIRGDFYWYAIDNIQNVVANQSTGVNGPANNIVPLAVEVIAGSSAPGTSLTLNSGSMWVGDTGNNELSISDGTIPTRKATVTSAGALKVDPSGVTQPTTDLAEGSVGAGTAGTKSELAGCTYNTSLPAPTNGQQVSIQCDSSGRTIVVIKNQVLLAQGSLVTQAAAYSVGNDVGGLIHLTNFFPGGSGTLAQIKLVSNGGITTNPGCAVYVFNANPSASTFTDKGTFSIAAADWPKVITATNLTAAFGGSGASGTPFVQTNSLSVSITTTDIWIAFDGQASFTGLTTSDFNYVVTGTQ